MRARPLTNGRESAGRKGPVRAAPAGIATATSAAAVPTDRPTLVLERAAVLSNGRFVRWVTSAGTGGSSLDSIDLTPWRPDPVDDRQGWFAFIRDRDDDSFWSLGCEPIPCAPDAYEVAWHPGRFEITRRERGIDTTLETCVAPGAPAEVARITVRNRTSRKRSLELTSYAEVLLLPRAAGAAHPAFAKLFVETEFAADEAALLARRRPREPSERFPVLVHGLAGPGTLQLETDRARWVGRGRSLAEPHAMIDRSPLSGSTGSVLDPIVSLRRVFELGPGETTMFALLLGAADDRAAALAMVRHFADPAAAEDALEHAVRARQGAMERAGIEPASAEAAEALAVALRHADRPTPLVRFDARDARGAVDLDAFRAVCRYWEALGVPVEAVVLQDDPATPGEPDAGTLPDLVLEAGLPRVTTEVRIEGFLHERGDRRAVTSADAHAPKPRADEDVLRFDNGWGGFSQDGREYVIRLFPERKRLAGPPLPWINILANAGFGSIVSETGAGYTWSRNSQRHRITPWHNDPVLDPHGEALYVRDPETGESWSPLPGPVASEARHEARHGFGYTRFRHASHGLEHDTVVFVARDEPVKVTRVRITNTGDRARRLALVSYQQLVLGVRPVANGAITARYDEASRALFARNPDAGEFADGVAFAAAVGGGPSGSTGGSPSGSDGRPTAWTADRSSFLGRRGHVAAPAALRPGRTLEAKAGAGGESCFALELALEVAAGATVECAFLLGECGGADEARALISRWREDDAVERGLDAVRSFWSDLVDRVRIETPAPEIDLMVNGWLAYQTLTSRMWGRTALYQSGGAVGFRDQLQDSLALGAYDPAFPRDQILLHAAHQFPEGDVLHWWHPPAGPGLRTRFADDLLWLPLATAEHIARTGDTSLLDRRLPFVEAPALEADESETLVDPVVSDEAEDLYGHCCRAIDRSLGTGAHGLPRFGAGDWNDGMNRVGREGRGESVWMGFFLHAVLGAFLPLCAARGDRERATRYEAHRARLRSALETAGWDGSWYLRGYFDDGTPLGSAGNAECQIDAVAQAWSVISGAAPRARCESALDAVERRLASPADGILRLLWPPFDRTPHDPGYIKAYVPGVRENGGQYTHAALWVVRALAELGKRDRAAAWLARLSPVSHAGSPERARRYRGEPYVIAADVYGVEPHVGRVGWTWYTGSAGWMLRVALESVLGVRFENGNVLVLAPRVPDAWPGFRVACAVPGESTRVEIVVANPRGRAEAVVAARRDGIDLEIAEGVARIEIPRDGATHRIEVELG